MIASFVLFLIYVYVSLLCDTVIDCGAPLNATGVIIDPFNDTEFGALITFHCKNSMTAAVCSSDGEWSTSPASLKCGDTCSCHGRSMDIFYCLILYVAIIILCFNLKSLLPHLLHGVSYIL